MRVRSIELVQRIEYLDLIHITNVLNEKSCIKDYALITHDKDVKEDGTPVAPHLHLMMRFSEVQDTKYIAKWFNVGEQYLCKIKGRFADALMYLTHENAPEKYQYSEDDVISNFDFRKEKEKKSNNLRREEIINKIACGEIREFNLFDSVNAIEYDKYRRNIENAFLYRQKILLKEINREMEVVFISGASGSGKTTYAKMMCENQNYSYFISSSSNDPFDGYAGQDAVILDDLRGSSFTFADLLKITDNHTSSSVKSRYKNKILECKLLIITSIMPIDEFYSNVFESSDEPLIQFERRCQTYIVMDKTKMVVYGFDNSSMKYHRFGVSKNPVAQKLDFEKANSLKRRLEVIQDTLCGIKFDESLDFEEVEENIKW